MTTMDINRKQSQGNHWQETLQDYKARMTKQQQTQQVAPESDKTISAHKVKSTSRKAPQKPTSEPQQRLFYCQIANPPTSQTETRTAVAMRRYNIHQQAEIQREGNLYVVICCIVQHTNTTNSFE
ncbi:hypothetical protein ZQ65_19650 [Salmonella enterica subsp. enterica serovar Newport]|uniref:Uncharacterized protein n=1 Tax=Salmonella newport TaxID=108619 RepID=A0A5U9KS53_SALNE|nr:hypothetical protein [Salmonella enterica subsp. enterica serovar Newport]ECN8541930.1 hypothetical protein [Salmonella enterica subsp. enterica serovar Newport]EJH8885456.1 hypothetical protein [Salmonella enterica]